VLNESGQMVTTANAEGIYRADIAGLHQVRARISGYASGSVTVRSRALPLALPVLQSVQATGRTSALAVTLANAVAIRDTNQYIYRLVEEGGLTLEQIRNASSLVVLVRSTLNQPGSLIVSPSHSPNSSLFAPALRYYNNASFFSGGGAGTTARFQPAGTADAPGATGIIEIPGFAYPQSNVQFAVQFNSAPTSGALSIHAILGG